MVNIVHKLSIRIIKRIIYNKYFYFNKLSRSVGYNGEPEFENIRLVQLFMYSRNFAGDNHYAHPLNFVVGMSWNSLCFLIKECCMYIILTMISVNAVVDLIAGKVISIDDLPIHNDFTPQKDDNIKIPRAINNYDPEFLPENFMRKDLKPLEVHQPKGPSFSVIGNEISWQKFRIRIG